MKKVLLELEQSKQELVINGSKRSVFHNLKYRRQDYLLAHHNIIRRIRGSLIIDGISYAELMSTFLVMQDYYLPQAPATAVIFEYIDIIDGLKLGKGDVLELKVNDFYKGLLLRCALVVAAGRGFRVKVLENKIESAPIKYVYSNHHVFRQSIKAAVKLRYIFGLWRRITGKADRKPADVLFLSSIRHSKGTPEENMMYGDIIKELKKSSISSKIILYENITTLSDTKTIIKRFLNQKQSHQSYIGEYYRLKNFSMNRKLFLKLRRRWRELKDDAEFRQAFNYRGYDIFKLARPRLELMFNALNYFICDNVNITKQIMANEKSKLVVIDNEEGIYGKALLLNNRLGKKNTLALCHEIIFEGCDYIYPEDKAALDRSSAIWRPLPDVKCVWGDFSKKILSKSCNYPAESIKVTGNPKFKRLFDTSLDKDAIIKKYSLSKQKKKLLCALFGNPYYLYELDKLSKEIDLEVIVKPHPYDPNIEDIKRIMGSFNNPNMKLIPNKDDIYPFIHVSDYVLVRESTVGLEAMMLGKIVLVHDPFEKELDEGLPYTSSKATIRIINIAKDVKRVVQKLSTKERTNLVRNMHGFVNDYISTTNDNSTKLVVKEIKKLL
ncbi:MAG: hypothetical protein V1866_00085 [archaeon]